jgi:hypothetical protein
VIKALESILADKLEAKEEAKLANPLPDLPYMSLLEKDKGKDKLKRVKVQPPATARPPPPRGMCCSWAAGYGLLVCAGACSGLKCACLKCACLPASCAADMCLPSICTVLL